MASAGISPRHQLPDNVSQLEADETFCFECDPEVSCFTECCRQLELALTPYDVLRLRQELQLGSADFLEQYVVADQDARDAFPHLYLAMRDDETGRCPFVTATGCGVYNGRPGACRTYPLGRAAFFDANGNRQAFHVLIREPHCKGFLQSTVFTVQSWSADQGLDEYNQFNDEVMALPLHERIRQGFRPDKGGCDKYILALYNLDQFRNLLNNKGIAARHEEMDDAGLLRYAVEWLKEELF